MKVAIIGAGPCGMACAHELERHGIFPDLFEQRNRPGEMFTHCAAVLEIFTRPYNPLDYLSNQFNLELQSIAKIKKIQMNSPNKEVSVKGNLGYFFLRGQDSASVETQLSQKLRTTPIFNTRAEYSELSPAYDYVVVANGGGDASRREGLYNILFETKLIGGTVIGDFDPNTLHMWIDTRYSKNVYAYLCPIEKKRAFLGLIINDCTVEEAREKWKLFWEIEQHPYNQINEIIVEHNAGFVYPHQVGNILFAGVAGGFQEPFLGFGLMTSITSGVLAGRAIATRQNYEELLFQLKKDMEHSLVLRKAFNKAGNKDFDTLLSLLSIPPLKKLIYNTNIDWVRMGTNAMSMADKLLGKIKKN